MPMLDEGMQAAVDYGDALFLSYGLTTPLTTGQSYLSLPEMEREAHEEAALNRKLKNDRLVDGFLRGRLILISLLAPPPQQQRDAEDVVVISEAEEAYIAEATALSPTLGVAFFIWRARVQYVLRRPDLALETLRRANMSYAPGSQEEVWYNLIQSLVNLTLIRQLATTNSHTIAPTPTSSSRTSSPTSSLDDFSTPAAWSAVKDNQSKVDLWVKGNAENFIGIRELVEAEMSFTTLVELLESDAADSLSDHDVDQQVDRIVSQYRTAILDITHSAPATPASCGSAVADSARPLPPTQSTCGCTR